MKLDFFEKASILIGLVYAALIGLIFNINMSQYLIIWGVIAVGIIAIIYLHRYSEMEMEERMERIERWERFTRQQTSISLSPSATLSPSISLSQSVSESPSCSPSPSPEIPDDERICKHCGQYPGDKWACDHCGAPV